jgi:creatinine amidohydrolase
VAYEAEGSAARVAQALPDWNIVMMPPIHYGEGGANAIGDMLVHPGTYGIRQSTLRSLVANIGGQLAQNGFKWIFVMTGHGAPRHGIAINEACDFVSETFGVTMLHVTALFRADAAIQSRGDEIDAAHFSPEDIASFGMDVHGGVSETSGMLAVRPDLVHSSYATLPSQAGRTLEELRAIATTPGWQGYFSSPAKATAAHGRAVEAWWIDGMTELILEAVNGENLLTRPRDPETVPPAAAAFLDQVLESERAFEATLESWLARRGTR